ncbi:hypothetical protein CHS0354_033749 [Potamilus streckersoni]|uniref:Uncharacterized protein n=1 Tax=Potamilus streckersoni TaxID=2493646 RepID=A0AAE0S2C9_9BIVA|nr:hypothetical protein CHS0354_033749 [Potamilus streckersoni]
MQHCRTKSGAKMVTGYCRPFKALGKKQAEAKRKTLLLTWDISIEGVDLNNEELGDYGLLPKPGEAEDSNTTANVFNNVSGLPEPTSISTQTTTRQHHMKDVEAQMDITILETTSAPEQAKTLNELEAMRETEDTIHDTQDTEEEVDDMDDERDKFTQRYT